MYDRDILMLQVSEQACKQFDWYLHLFDELCCACTDYLNYLEFQSTKVSFCDVFQVGAAMIDPDEYLIHILYKFGVQKWLEWVVFWC